MTTNKTTDTVQSVEQKLLNEYQILKDRNVGKERHREARIKIKRLQEHLNNISDKEFNGKKYPKRQVPPKCTKEELLKLIDSVDSGNSDDLKNDETILSIQYGQGLDVTGVFISKE